MYKFWRTIVKNNPANTLFVSEESLSAILESKLIYALATTQSESEHKWQGIWSNGNKLHADRLENIILFIPN